MKNKVMLFLVMIAPSSLFAMESSKKEDLNQQEEEKKGSHMHANTDPTTLSGALLQKINYYAELKDEVQSITAR